jgi:predicted small lipoprotein YifL
MIKKIILTLLLSCTIVSCGKKGDPIYGDPKKEAAIQIVHLNRA